MEGGGEWAAAPYSLVVASKLNEVDPQVWLADVLVFAEHPALDIGKLFPVELAARVGLVPSGGLTIP